MNYIAQVLKRLTISYLKFIILIFLSYGGIAQIFSANLQKAYREACAFRLSEARSLLKTENEQNPFSVYVRSHTNMLELMVSENEAQYETHKKNETIDLATLQTLPDSSPYKGFLQAEILLHHALLKLRFRHDVAGAWNIIKAYRILAKNQQKFPDFVPQKKSLGALHVLIGSAPEAYTWVVKVLGLQGDIARGLRELKEAQQENLWGNEATWINLYLQGYVLKWSAESQKNLQSFVHKNPSNALIQFLAVAVSIKNNQSDKAASYLHGTQGDMPIMTWYMAEIALQNGDFQKAERYFSAFLKAQKGKSFLKETYLKLFFCKYLRNESGEVFLQKIPRVGNTFAEADKAAQRFFDDYTETKQLPNPILLKARLAFDGGFYAQAKQILETSQEDSFATTTDRAEWNYRMGRIEQKTAQTVAAIAHFERAIALDKTLTRSWFGAASSLQLGYIYQEKGKKALAHKYFEQTLAYKNHAYKNSFDNKARAALAY